MTALAVAAAIFALIAAAAFNNDNHNNYRF